MQNTFFVLILISLFVLSCYSDAQPIEQKLSKDTSSIANPIPLTSQIPLSAEDSIAKELQEIEALLGDIEDLDAIEDSLSWELDYNLTATFEAEVANLDNISLENWQTKTSTAFKQAQMQFESVRQAYASHQTQVQKLLVQQAIYNFDIDLYIRAFKQESELEIWAKSTEEKEFKLLTTYHFYKGATELGPKQREGDMQVPEGCYFIDYFNPHSDYVLSMRINYPNAVDSVRNANEAQMGSAICIHGNIMSIGCLAITDLRIPVLYILATEAMKDAQTKIPVHIFPYRMTSKNQKKINPNYPQNHDFWSSLGIIYKEFEKEQYLPKIKCINGLYRIKTKV